MLAQLHLLLWRGFSFAFSVIIAFVVISSTSNAQELLTQSRQNELTNLVRQDCGSCHGMTLKGGLGRGLLPHDLKDFSTNAVAEIILKGVPETPMPPWADLLSQGDAMWIAKSLKQGSIHRGNIK